LVFGAVAGGRLSQRSELTMEKQVYLTLQGKQKLEQELDYLVHVPMPR
jgi:hypothetical protein